MAIENTVLELLAPIVIVASSYALTVIYNVAPFDKNYSKDINNVVFCMIPLALYVVGRLYFGIAFLLTDKFLANYKAAASWINTVAVLGGITGLVMQDTVYSTIRNIYEDRIGYLPKVIYDLSKPSFDTSMEFGIKIVGLIVGWFLLLFILEVIARVVLLIVGAIVRTIFYKKEEKENGSEAVC